MINHSVLGLDLAKHIFHLVVLSRTGKVQSKRVLRRSQVLRYISQSKVDKIAMEACAGAHYWARTLSAQGYTVELLPPQHIKAYLRGQKNDFNDARAIAEAAQHGVIRPVSIKTVQQQDTQSFHRVRQHLLVEQTRLVNHLRGLLAEYGFVVAQGINRLKQTIPEILEDAENGLSNACRELLHRQYHRLLLLNEELQWYDQRLEQQVKEDSVCQRLMSIPGIGPVVSSLLSGWLGDGSQFKRGRDASAALGLVPRQYSSGGKQQLYGITKRGDKHLRSALIHGARAVVAQAGKKQDRLSVWIQRLVAKRGYNKATVALANKLARIAWAVVTNETRYRPA